MFGHDATRSSFALARVLLDGLLAMCFVERLVGSARDARSSATMHSRTGTETALDGSPPRLFGTSFASRIARELQLAVRRARWPGNVAPNHPNHADDLSHRFRRGEAHGHASEIERGRAVVALWRLLCPRTRRLGQ